MRILTLLAGLQLARGAGHHGPKLRGRKETPIFTFSRLGLLIPLSPLIPFMFLSLHRCLLHICYVHPLTV